MAVAASFFCISCFIACAGEMPFGYIEPYQTIKVCVSESGILAELFVIEGETVKKDQLLGRLDCRVMDQELAIEKALLEHWQKRFAKHEELKQQGRLSSEEFDKAQMDFRVQALKVKRLEAQIESRTLRSPVEGVVTEIKRHLSESVSPASPHVVTVVEMERLSLQLYLTPEQSHGLKQGAETVLRLIDAEGSFPALLEFVSPVTDAASNTVRIRLSLRNPERKIPTGAKATLDVFLGK